MSDNFSDNILGVQDLVTSDTNKSQETLDQREGIVGDVVDELDLPMDDSELLDLSKKWDTVSAPYSATIEPRAKKNKEYIKGVQRANSTTSSEVVPTNMIFEALETFIPEALSKNPEPVVWSDNTDEGKRASNEIKTMLQFHADTLCLRKKLGVMIRHWSVYFIAVLKYGWDAKIGEIVVTVRNPKNFKWDPDGFIDEYGDYQGEFLGDPVSMTAKKLIDKYPEHKTYITLKVDGKLGTKVQYTEWWTNDYTFSTFEDIVLEKLKNPYFNYGDKKQLALPDNHFAVPKMPFTFLSVFSLQEQPHDYTNLVEQSIPNQNRINDRDAQIDSNLESANNGIVIDADKANDEEAAQIVQSFYEQGMIRISGGTSAVTRVPANNLPNAIFEAQQGAKEALRAVFGTGGFAQTENSDQPVRNTILNEQHSSTRTGGGIGEALEQVADNCFNWLLQLYCVFYDEPHFAAVLGKGRAVDMVQLSTNDLTRKFVVSVSPNSMKPKDEVSEMNQSIELANSGWLDPINLFKRLDDADPMETAKMVTLYKMSPQLYAQMFFPEAASQQAMTPQQGGEMQPSAGTPEPTLAAPAGNTALSNVALPNV
jgi:hypothetical protein